MLFSIGHSNYSQEAFTLSIKGRISTVIDVRSHPESRWAQYERREMQRWLPEAGIGYEWWPGLGGWDRRHERLADQFEPKGVDLHVYARGKFPKQRIATRHFGKGIDPACPSHGCNSRIGFGTQRGTRAGSAMRRPFFGLALCDAGCRSPSSDPLEGNTRATLGSMRICPRSAEGRQLVVPGIGFEPSPVGALRSQVSCCTPQSEQSDKYGTLFGSSAPNYGCDKTDCGVSVACTCDNKSSGRPYWNSVGLWDYSYFMTLPEFLEDCDRLIERGKKEDLGFMCCEATWWRCHRSLICDYLSFRGVESFHLTPHWRQKNKIRFVDGFRTAPHSKYLGNRLDRYEPEIVAAWESWRAREGKFRETPLPGCS